MSVVHDIHCRSCDYEEGFVRISDGVFPPCPKCDGETTWTPVGFFTDVHGSPRWNEASGQYHSSTREVEKHMARLGYYPKGDKEGGARPTLRIENRTASYAGQGSRRSSGEHEQDRRRRPRQVSREKGLIQPKPAPGPSPKGMDAYLNGPQRLPRHPD